MDKQIWMRLLLRTHTVGLPAFLLLSAWTLFALLGDPYALQRQPGAARQRFAPEIAYKPHPPVEEYLRVVRSREMFKPSIIYETKKSEVTNVLGELVFLGVVRDGANIQALIQNKKSGQSSFYSSGQALEDLEIQEVRDDKVVFKHGEEVLELVR